MTVMRVINNIEDNSWRKKDNIMKNGKLLLKTYYDIRTQIINTQSK